MARLPGVVFEAPTPVPEDTLPRMDIAAFVGFAAAGPLHTPVPIDSPRRFRDVFRPDPVLAWDAARGEMRHAQLGGAVDAFFANGGLRCWVVRVADEATAIRHSFAIPGLIDASDRHASPAPFAQALARAAGSWCEDLSIGSSLGRDPLPLQDDDSVVLAPGGYQVTLAAGRTRVRPGDLLEIAFVPGAPILLLFAERVIGVPGGLRVESAGIESGETAGAFWIRPATIASPSDAQADLESVAPVALDEATAIAEVQASWTTPPSRPTVRRLSFELLVWQGTELRHSMADLAFGSAHPRCWATLPCDETLFAIKPGLAQPGELTGLAHEAAAPRFPLAGPVCSAAAEPTVHYYLPWGMGRLRRPDSSLALPAEATASSTALERDGLARFAPGLFLDHRLAHLGSGALLAEAEHRYYVSGQALTGVHSLLPIEEASLIAIPDAAHREWTRALPPEGTLLGPPLLQPVGEADAAGRYPLTWSSVEHAGGYLLQYALSPSFATAVAAFEGDALSTAVALPQGCPRDVFFRVRAYREGQIGPWSNTRVARLPEEAFVACSRRPLDLVLEFTGDSASPGPALTWTPEASGEPMPEQVEIESASDPAFASGSPFAPDVSPGRAPLDERRSAARYYRIRGLEGGEAGPWSNTVHVPATDRSDFAQRDPQEFDPSLLLSLHRALLRFAAARGDLLALLSLPDHYRTDDAIDHTALLTPGGPELEPTPPASSTLFPRVPPLTEGEVAVLSYGALYHPWIVMRGTAADATLRTVPPEGAVAGVLAGLALQEGAWRAPANRVFTGGLALTPSVRTEDWPRLVTGRVNVVVNDVRGLLTRSEDTLGGERALGRVHVRRLMILLRRIALREGERWVFEPHGPILRRRVRQLFERLLAELFQRGAFAGRDASEAFRVVTDDTVNPPVSVDAGRLIVELRVAPAAALAFITVRLLTAGAGRLAVEEA